MRWPIDVLRPEVSFPKAMRGRIERETSSPTEHAQDNIVANQALATVPTSVRFDKTAELEQANVLYSLLENKFSKRVSTWIVFNQNASI